MDPFIKGVVDSYTNYNDLEEFAALIDIDNDSMYNRMSRIIRYDGL